MSAASVNQNNDQAYFRVVGIEPRSKENPGRQKAPTTTGQITSPLLQKSSWLKHTGAHIENPTILDYKNLREGVRLGGLGPEFKPGR